MDDTTKVLNLRRDGEFLYRRGLETEDPVDSVSLLRAALAQSPGNNEYRMALAVRLAMLGRVRLSGRILMPAMQDSDWAADAWNLFFNNMLADRDAPAAETAQHMFIKTFGATGNEKAMLEAMFSFARGVRMLPQEGPGGNLRILRSRQLLKWALARFDVWDDARCEHLLLRALRLAPNFSDALALLAHVKARSGCPKRALKLVRRAMSGKDLSIFSIVHLSEALCYLGAMEISKSLLALAAGQEDERSPDEWLFLIEQMADKEMYAAIQALAGRLLEQSGENPALMHALAVSMYRTGAPREQYIRPWQRILRVDPEDQVAIWHLKASEKAGFNPSVTYGLPPVAQAEMTIELIPLAFREEDLKQRWREDDAFQKRLLWMARNNNMRAGSMVYSVLACVDDDEANAAVRQALLSGSLTCSERLRLLNQCKRLKKNPVPDIPKRFLPSEAKASIEDSPQLTLGEKQILRSASRFITRMTGRDASTAMEWLWRNYRDRKTAGDVLNDTCAICAVLTARHLWEKDAGFMLSNTCEAFGVPLRKGNYYWKQFCRTDVQEQHGGDGD